MSDEKKTKLFLSWEGERSLKIAKILNQLIPEVINVSTLFLSSEIGPGRAWHGDIMKGLRSANFGIAICTPENRDSEWLHHEAGALAMKSENSLQVLCVGFEPPDNLPAPLREIQAVSLGKAGLKAVLTAINLEILVEDNNKQLFDILYNIAWEKYGEQLVSISKEKPSNNKTGPSEREILMDTRSITIGIWKKLHHTPGRHIAMCKLEDGSIVPREVVVNTSITDQMVRSVQVALRSKGYAPGPSDNEMGNETKKALVKFQKDNDLPAGQLDFETLKALGVEY